MFTVDFRDDAVYAWSRTGNGVECEHDPDYTPTVYLEANDWATVAENREHVDAHPNVAATAREEWRPGFREDPTDVLRVDVTGVDAVRTVARQLRSWERSGTFRLFNVDFTPAFRYCLETDADPTPNGSLRTLAIDVPATEFAGDDPEITECTVRSGDGANGDGSRGAETVAGNPETVVERVGERVESADPDVLVLSTARLIPVLFETARERGVDFQLGRRPGYRKRAGASTYESYGRVGHSPARYGIPGRAVIDRENTFFYRETNLAGCLDLVSRSGKPLQELAWASIGNVLTAIQVREALDRNVLVPWRSWRAEFFKTMGQLQDADRGGYTFSPRVGVHEDVHELDFASLYPNIIVTRNVSPETVRCDCHPDREDVPGLGYAVCDEQGYLPEVLSSLVDARDGIKRERRSTDDPERRETLAGRSAALKWILVACFGYQGFSNAKFGRIECHEAINAFAREILLDAKAALEAGGWEVVHGIVDSVWVTPREGVERRPLDALAAEITDDVGVRLEYEAAYDWVAFVPRRDSNAGALTKYFGKRASEGGTEGGAEARDDGGNGGEDAFKYRGVECRQRSTPEWVADVQRDLIAALDRYREPEPVCGVLAQYLQRLDAERVDPADLAVSNRVSKEPGEYAHYTHSTAAVERADDAGLDVEPGQSVDYVVVDDERDTRERVALAAEESEGYDADYYRDRALRAAESVLSPLGWRRGDIEAYLADREDAAVTAYGGAADGDGP
ncbi:type B DNA-directed DNA polymerase [Halostella sp. PRR32]|uniref:type B DNA-directed DNA polymerase n=1 Tax=Halostella sp. PRR32 TaxID=3098147 RepID=UPI002B1D6D1B|nr:type B DNA-directed DNA polymerase [Halostella sp. PRR32]